MLLNLVSSHPINPKSQLINHQNHRTVLLPISQRGRLTDPTQSADQQCINININLKININLNINLNINITNHHHQPKATISYLHLLSHKVDLHRMAIKQASISQFKMLASVRQQQKLIRRKRSFLSYRICTI